MRHHITALFASVRTYQAVRLALALAFVAAGASKLADVHAFALTIKAFAILPPHLATPVATLLPVLEVLGGLLLACDLPGGLALIGSLLVLFLGVVAQAIGQGLDIDCGCYGPGDPEGDIYHSLHATAWRDLAMLAGVLYCLLHRRSRGRSTPPRSATQTP